VRLSTELSFPRSVPFLKWSEEEDVLPCVTAQDLQAEEKTSIKSGSIPAEFKAGM
jgi:hypothetical protein